MQSSELRPELSLMAHRGKLLQVLEEDSQKSPVADVQGTPEVPQTQGPALAVVPSL